MRRPAFGLQPVDAGEPVGQVGCRAQGYRAFVEQGLCDRVVADGFRERQVVQPCGRRREGDGVVDRADGAPGTMACLALLRDAAREFATGHHTTHWWPYLTAPAATRLAPLYPERPLHLEDDALIPLPGAGIDDYIASLPSRRRVGIRRERRAFAAVGLDVRHRLLEDCFEDAGVLLAGHQQGHGHDRDGIDAMTGLLKRQAAAMGSEARVVSAHDGQRMIGFCLYYHYGTTTWIRAVAVDRHHPAPHLYFNLMYYLPIQDAYAHGTTGLHAGMTTVEAKRRRGAVVSGLYALVDRPGQQPPETVAVEPMARVAGVAQQPAPPVSSAASG
ncbi:GNAT family N-acetyltransferase [Streptomyces sp. NPDC058279]|uniref:GNAT family N-acetyltransferase n=1 Tax=Streptomyces sp. NPDC058279 TaxID=3346418 RepID=UPI0036E34914